MLCEGTYNRWHVSPLARDINGEHKFLGQIEGVEQTYAGNNTADMLQKNLNEFD